MLIYRKRLCSIKGLFTLRGDFKNKHQGGSKLDMHIREAVKSDYEVVHQIQKSS